MSDNQDLMRLELESNLELSSLKAMARDAEYIMLLVDTSGSMQLRLTNGQRAIDCLRSVVLDVKAQNPDLPMIAFGGPYDCQVRFVDVVPEPDGGTPMHAAIRLAKSHGATRLVVVSDGMPDLRDETTNAAQEFGGKIDVMFIGKPGDSGSLFLEELAKLTGGTRKQGDLLEPKKLTGAVIGLLNGEVEEKRAPLTGPGFSTVDEDEVIDAEDAEGDDEEDEESDEE